MDPSFQSDRTSSSFQIFSNKGWNTSIDTSWAAFITSAGMPSGPAAFPLLSVLIAFLISYIVVALRPIYGKPKWTKMGYLVILLIHLVILLIHLVILLIHLLILLIHLVILLIRFSNITKSDFFF